MMSLTMILIVVAVAQWALFAGVSAFSRAAYPKKGMRGSERYLIVSSFVLLALWLTAFDVRALFRSQPKPKVAEAAVVAGKQTGSCASIGSDATAAEVRKLMGEPDEKRSNEETRGPGATIWVYRGPRCAVHLFEDRVEFVE